MMSGYRGASSRSVGFQSGAAADREGRQLTKSGKGTAMTDDDEQPDRRPIARQARGIRRAQADPADRVQEAGAEEPLKAKSSCFYFFPRY
jgi:hypothetical protein